MVLSSFPKSRTLVMCIIKTIGYIKSFDYSGLKYQRLGVQKIIKCGMFDMNIKYFT